MYLWIKNTYIQDSRDNVSRDGKAAGLVKETAERTENGSHEKLYGKLRLHGNEIAGLPKIDTKMRQCSITRFFFMIITKLFKNRVLRQIRLLPLID